MTLGTLTAVRGFARLLGRDQTVINTDLPFAYVGSGTLFGIPFLVVIAAATTIASWFILRRTVLGIYVYSVGGNSSGARLAGIRVWAVLLFVYSFSGLCAGLGGVMSAGRLYAANGIQLGQSYELDAIAAVILGGTSFVGGIGSIWGTLIGALIIAVMSNGLILTGVPDVWQYIVKGLVIIGAVTLDRYPPIRKRAGLRTSKNCRAAGIDALGRSTASPEGLSPRCGPPFRQRGKKICALLPQEFDERTDGGHQRLVEAANGKPLALHRQAFDVSVTSRPLSISASMVWAEMKAMPSPAMTACLIVSLLPISMCRLPVRSGTPSR